LLSNLLSLEAEIRASEVVTMMEMMAKAKENIDEFRLNQ
jgi:hypothetical protein